MLDAIIKNGYKSKTIIWGVVFSALIYGLVDNKDLVLEIVGEENATKASLALALINTVVTSVIRAVTKEPLDEK